MPSKPKFDFHIHQGQKEVLDCLAKTSELSRSAMIRQAITFWLKEKRGINWREEADDTE